MFKELKFRNNYLVILNYKKYVLSKKDYSCVINCNFSFFVGWCLVWKLYLSKFKLVRELFSQQAPEVDSSSKTQKTL